MRIINKTVLVLSIVSMFADIASEMLYPVVPVYLKEIGFSVFFIGLLEGVAEFTAGLSKGYFGKKSDEKGKRLPFIKSGYFLSAVSKPMMAVFSIPIWIFLARAIDRLGKGLRTAARDALLSDNATSETKARVFGFHRSLDTLGAFLGPLIALGFLHLFPQQYRPLFYWALLPGLISVALIFLLKEVPKPASTIKKGGFFSFFIYWKIASPAYKKLVTGLLLFALINSSDVFLLLKVKEVTGSDTITLSAYILYNLFYAIASYPLGLLADKIGMKRIFIAGLLLFSLAYFVFGFGQLSFLFFIGFFIYALYAAATEGIGKAWITNLSHHTNTASAVGFYTSCQSISSLIASALAGLMWSVFGSTVVFMVPAILTLFVAGYFLTIPFWHGNREI